MARRPAIALVLASAGLLAVACGDDDARSADDEHTSGADWACDDVVEIAAEIGPDFIGDPTPEDAVRSTLAGLGVEAEAVPAGVDSPDEWVVLDGDDQLARLRVFESADGSYGVGDVAYCPPAITAPEE